MANRKGVFIGAYVPNHLKESLRRRAAAEHRTLSQEITRILEEAVHGIPVADVEILMDINLKLGAQFVPLMLGGSLVAEKVAPHVIVHANDRHALGMQALAGL